MHNKKMIKITTGITALALTCSLTITGCNYRKNDKFYFSYSLSGEEYINRNDYISSEYINNYYVIEIYHTILNKSTIYIAYRYQNTSGYSKYTNVFTNYKIAYDPDELDYYEFIKVTPLIDLLEEYNLVKDKYTYQDMQYIYKTIEENYTFNETKSKTRKKEINN